jgi:hypothetical protein
MKKAVSEPRIGASMKKLVIVIVILLASQTGALAGSPQELWQGATLGMSVKQVLDKFPKGIQNPKPEHLLDGAQELVVIPRIALGTSRTAKVEFYFLQEHLTQVTLAVDVTDADQTKLAFESMIDALRARYGPEISLRSTTLGFEAEWFLPSGVNVDVVAYTKVMPLLRIVYQVRLKGTVDQL